MIRIVGKDNNEKGKVFEHFVIKMLDGLGYHRFRTVRKTGRQIDILAQNRVTDQPIICECKAYKDKLNGEHLSKFRGLYDHEYDKNNSMIGILFSLSGFNDGLLEYYDEIDEAVKKRFKIYSYEDIFFFIKKSKIIESEETINHIIRTKLPYDIQNKYLSVSDYGEYWITTFGINAKETHFTVLSAKGEEVQKYIIEGLINVDPKIKKLIPINLNIHTKVILCLSDKKTKTLNQISKEIGESSSDVELALFTLKQNDKIQLIENGYRINNELDIFIILSKEFLTSTHKVEYFRSNYVQANIDDRLINYIKTRFYMDFEDGQKEVIAKLLKISPSALLQSLTHPTDIYKTGFQQIKDKNLSSQIKENWMKNISSSVLMILATNLISDLKSKKSTKILTDKNLKGYSINIETKFASSEELYFQLKVGGFVMLAKAKGRIEAGHLVSATDLSYHLDSANIFINLKEFGLAFEEFDKIINNSNDKHLLSAAWNNKGLVYTIINKFDEAIECYKKSIEANNGIKEPYCNIGRALKCLNKNDESEFYFKKALEIDPDYDDAKLHLKNLDIN